MDVLGYKTLEVFTDLESWHVMYLLVTWGMHHIISSDGSRGTTYCFFLMVLSLSGEKILPH